MIFRKNIYHLHSIVINVSQREKQNIVMKFVWHFCSKQIPCTFLIETMRHRSATNWHRSVNWGESTCLFIYFTTPPLIFAKTYFGVAIKKKIYFHWRESKSKKNAPPYVWKIYISPLSSGYSSEFISPRLTRQITFVGTLKYSRIFQTVRGNEL